MSGPNWTVLHDMDHQFDSQCPECQQWLAEAIRDYLRSPAAEKALASRLFGTYGDAIPAPIRHDWEADARAILKAWQP